MNERALQTILDRLRVAWLGCKTADPDNLMCEVVERFDAQATAPAGLSWREFELAVSYVVAGDPDQEPTAPGLRDWVLVQQIGAAGSDPPSAA